MLFNSLAFLIFFPLVAIIYYLIPRHNLRLRNLLLLVASYYFYMCSIPAYALILLSSTLITYFSAILMGRKSETGRRKRILTYNIILNISILFFFKYFNFLSDNILSLTQQLGLQLSRPGFNILLPVGISFYIFQALGYTIDVYRGKTLAERDFITYALFVSFFPQLVAGPIERSYQLLPQFKQEHRLQYDNIAAGARLMIWGYFLKLVLADRCALFVDSIFDNVQQHNGGSYLLATLMFTFQIYGDFAGYSLIATGVARMLGFRLMENFHRPYFATSLTDFWRRWHISLSSWFKEYLYIPLGGSRVSGARRSFNLIVTFLVSGLWHGANWTFVCWGAIHGFFVALEKIFQRRKKQLSGIRRVIPCLCTFAVVSLLWVFFRARHLHDAVSIFHGMVTNPGMPFLQDVGIGNVAAAICAIVAVLVKDYADEKAWPVHIATSNHAWIRYSYFAFMICIITLFGVLGSDQFIYFQF